MKIVHICLCGPVTDGFAYQDNLLPKYHKILGYEVTVIASCWIRDVDGKLILTDQTDYINADGVRMMRLPIRRGNLNSRFKVYPGLYQAIDREQPDILFVHGCQFRDIKNIVKYKERHPKVRIYVDNHADYSNSARGWLSRNILHRVIWRHYAQMIAPYTERFYGVTPVREDFLVDMYGIAREHCDLLVMGIDDDQAIRAKTPGVRECIRSQYGVGKDDFLIVTGGKINHWRPETLSLMEAIATMDRPDIHLLIFGNVSEELRERFDTLLESAQIAYAGWQNALGTYEIMGSADLIIFPGLHSVMWEQAVGLGVPCIFRDIAGFHHIDIGGNAVLLQDVSTESLKQCIKDLRDDPVRYRSMRQVAASDGMKTFSYREIARRSIEET